MDNKNKNVALISHKPVCLQKNTPKLSETIHQEWEEIKLSIDNIFCTKHFPYFI